MSGMYTVLFGENPYSEYVLGLLNLDATDIMRFRDCGVHEERIWVYTRTGGANRETYPNEVLTAHPLSLSNSDDPFDSTYALFWFSTPANVSVEKGFQLPPDWKTYFKKMDDDPQFKEKEFEKFLRDAGKHVNVMRVR